MTFDRATTLCLACSSSLPPRSSSKPSELFTTNCCARPICPKCISSNPRLARYDPCLACLTGARVIQVNSSDNEFGSILGSSRLDNDHDTLKTGMNVDGSIKEQDLFVLGDDEEDAVELGEFELGGDELVGPGLSTLSEVRDGSHLSATVLSSCAGPAHVLLGNESSESLKSGPTTLESPSSVQGSDSAFVASGDAVQPTGPRKYHINRNDTLLGIAFRFKIDGSELCRLNNLPRSTLTTTPHLLHTRTYLTLPSSIPGSLIEDTAVCPTSRLTELAEKRLQTVTKETDCRIAKAYVALAEDDGDDRNGKEKLDVERRSECKRTLEDEAIDRYMDDAEWEENERKRGRGVSIQRFPFGGFGGKSSSAQARGSKWFWTR